MEFDLKNYNRFYWEENIINNPEFFATEDTKHRLTLEDLQEIIECDLNEQSCYDNKYLDENPF